MVISETLGTGLVKATGNESINIYKNLSGKDNSTIAFVQTLLIHDLISFSI